ncbi:MAG: hypothetical protein Ct9H300mP11_13840 [Chloroflexota bacterium]|nr:MAG: hypothetical protein Ct9H300mP11_13840 [Chloroflexota bacterium]
MPFVVARKAQALDGSTVVFNITGTAGRIVSVGVDGNRGMNLKPSRPPQQSASHRCGDLCLPGVWTMETIRGVGLQQNNHLR